MWYYNKKEFTQQDIPEGAIGFIYLMSYVDEDNKIKMYIGKKQLTSTTKVKLAKKDLSTDKRKKNYKTVTKYNYQNYYSSNDTLKALAKTNPEKITREILCFAKSKTELTYLEVKMQFEYKVLESDQYLNGNILGRFFRIK